MQVKVKEKTIPTDEIKSDNYTSSQWRVRGRLINHNRLNKNSTCFFLPSHLKISTKETPRISNKATCTYSLDAKQNRGSGRKCMSQNRPMSSAAINFKQEEPPKMAIVLEYLDFL